MPPCVTQKLLPRNWPGWRLKSLSGNEKNGCSSRKQLKTTTVLFWKLFYAKPTPKIQHLTPNNLPPWFFTLPQNEIPTLPMLYHWYLHARILHPSRLKFQVWWHSVALDPKPDVQMKPLPARRKIWPGVQGGRKIDQKKNDRFMIRSIRCIFFGKDVWSYLQMFCFFSSLKFDRLSQAPTSQKFGHEITFQLLKQYSMSTLAPKCQWFVATEPVEFHFLLRASFLPISTKPPNQPRLSTHLLQATIKWALQLGDALPSKAANAIPAALWWQLCIFNDQETLIP